MATENVENIMKMNQMLLRFAAVGRTSFTIKNDIFSMFAVLRCVCMVVK